MVANEKQLRMQRIRVGLTGLAAVLLTAAAAAAVFESTNGTPQPGGAANLATPSVAANADPAKVAGAPNEPLAEIGVTPGTDQAETAKPAVPLGLTPAPQTPTPH